MTFTVLLLELQKYYFALNSRFIFFIFTNAHINNVVSTLSNVVKLDVENDSIVSRLSNVVHINVEIDKFHSTLFSVLNFNVDVCNFVSTMI